MKFIALFALVAVCYAMPPKSRSGRNLNIDDDGTIVITGDNGKKIIISKTVGLNGQKNIDISVNGLNGVTKSIQIDDNDMMTDVNDLDNGGLSDVSYVSQIVKNSDVRKGSSQGDRVEEILRQYQGDVNEETYQQLMKQINAAVQSGEIDGLFYEALKNLGEAQSQDQEMQEYNQQQNQAMLDNQSQRQHNTMDLLLRKQDTQQKYTRQYQQGIQGYNDVPVSIMTPYIQQQSLAYDQGSYSPYATVPLMRTQGQVIEQAGHGHPQVVAYSPAEGLIYELKLASGPAVSETTYMVPNGPNGGKTTVVRVPVGNLLNTYGKQNLERPLNEFINRLTQPAYMSQLIQQEREEQRQAQQQMSQQEQQKLQQYKQLLQQLRQEQQEQEINQYQQKQQQMNQNQYQQLLQQQYLQQQQQPITYLLRTSPRQNRVQQVLLQQQQGGFTQRGVNGEYVPQQYTVPLVVY